MKIGHFETLRPVCPVCQAAGRDSAPLTIADVITEQDNDIMQGILHCSSQDCQHEYPIVDGIPIIVSQLRTFIANSVQHLIARDDLSAAVEGMIRDCCGPGSAWEITQNHLSSYAWDHYADWDPDEPPQTPRPGSILRVLSRAMQLAGETTAGHAIDVGCSVGRTTHALAAHTDGLVVGIDLNLAMLRVAARALGQGVVRYPRRRVGIVYDRREFTAQFEDADRIDFWACDATSLPFSSNTFATATCLNVLDCVGSPTQLLANISHVLAPGGKAMIACPYDWSSSATPIEQWVGGHSQRSPTRGDSEPQLRALLTPGRYDEAVSGLQILGEDESVAWHVRLHERSTVEYRTHVVAVERMPES